MTSNTTTSKASSGSWKQLISTLLLILLVFGVALAAAITLGVTAGWMRNPQNAVATVFTGTILGELAAFGLLVWQLHRRGQTLRDLGWGQPTRWRAIAIGIGVSIVYSGYTALNPGVGHHLLDFSLLKLLAIVTAIVAGVVEETIFRGYVITTLGRMGYGLVVQVLLSGLFFALFHLYIFTNLFTILTVQGLTFLLGVALAITYIVGKRSLTPVIISHALIDMVIEPWLFVSFFQ
jgi:uncharacterized protein